MNSSQKCQLPHCQKIWTKHTSERKPLIYYSATEFNPYISVYRYELYLRVIYLESRDLKVFNKNEHVSDVLNDYYLIYVYRYE